MSFIFIAFLYGNYPKKIENILKYQQKINVAIRMWMNFYEIPFSLPDDLRYFHYNGKYAHSVYSATRIGQHSCMSVCILRGQPNIKRQTSDGISLCCIAYWVFCAQRKQKEQTDTFEGKYRVIWIDFVFFLWKNSNQISRIVLDFVCGLQMRRVFLSF